MNFLKEFNDEINKIFSDIKLEIRIKICDFDIDNLSISSEVFREKSRFGYMSSKYNLISIFVEYNGNILFSITLSEFPNCCGKAIAYGFNLTNIVYLKNYHSINIENKHADIIKSLFKLIHAICSYCNYTQINFILSEIDNKFVFKHVNDLGYKPISSFYNRRYQNAEIKHLCHDYIIDVK